MKKILLLCGCAICVLCIPAISPVVPDVAIADIYQWKDESGTIHFTDTPSSIPEKYRSRQKRVLRAPSESGRPGLTIIESPAQAPSPIISEPPPVAQPQEPSSPPRQISSQAQVDQLRAKIAAKERFIESIDQKRSHVLNPLGNRFVAPEDQELYNKYAEELPQDRQQLKELQLNLP